MKIQGFPGESVFSSVNGFTSEKLQLTWLSEGNNHIYLKQNPWNITIRTFEFPRIFIRLKPAFGQCTCSASSIYQGVCTCRIMFSLSTDLVDIFRTTQHVSFSLIVVPTVLKRGSTQKYLLNRNVSFKRLSRKINRLEFPVKV